MPFRKDIRLTILKVWKTIFKPITIPKFAWRRLADNIQFKCTIRNQILALLSIPLLTFQLSLILSLFSCIMTDNACKFWFNQLLIFTLYIFRIIHVLCVCVCLYVQLKLSYIPTLNWHRSQKDRLVLSKYSQY